MHILDFGISRMIELSQAIHQMPLTYLGTTLWSFFYMATEQQEEFTEVDHSADLYALRVVIFQVLTRRLPFEGETASILAALNLAVLPLLFAWHRSATGLLFSGTLLLR
ncbi:hypothetical protein BCY86_01395 [Pajaroellobacter abortibovis]|uniref:Protein kinase domain-containing protein n=1 Tax=Pajaroellobacter abortibovis TaxID=1882918 RepID=A0A1L6MVD4_9BACT|nr:hypothetical protein BCY86_01395 [Pajaroellobacter abortibovis]